MRKTVAILLTLCLLAMIPALAEDYSDVFSDFDRRDNWTEAVIVTFSDDGIQVNGSGVSVDGTTATISQPGTYYLSGACGDGQLVLAVDKAEKVQLVLGGLTLACLDSAPLYVLSADKVSITLAPDSVNRFTDAAEYTRSFDNPPNACICSRDDLTINGTGELIVTGNSNNGIGTKNDLRILGGVITVTAAKNALKGNDSVAIADGTITLVAGKDAIKSDNAEDEGKGYIYIEGGTLDITAGDDAIQAQKDVSIIGGSIRVSPDGSIINSKGTENVASDVISEE